MIATRKRNVKRHRLTDRPKGHPFASGLFTVPLPPDPAMDDPMPAKRARVRWHPVDLVTLEDLEIDARAGEALAQDAYEGLIPWATAEEVSRTSVVGH